MWPTHCCCLNQILWTILTPALIYPVIVPRGPKKGKSKINYTHLLQVLASQQARVNLVNLAHPGTGEKDEFIIVAVHYNFFFCLQRDFNSTVHFQSGLHRQRCQWKCLNIHFFFWLTDHALTVFTYNMFEAPWASLSSINKYQLYKALKFKTGGDLRLLYPLSCEPWKPAHAHVPLHTLIIEGKTDQRLRLITMYCHKVVSSVLSN